MCVARNILIGSGIGIVALALPLTALAAITQPSQGGTGTGTIPAYGQVLVGNNAGSYTPTATSSLGISGGGTFPFTPTSFGVSTTSVIAFLNGIISAASSTFTGPLRLSSSPQGFWASAEAASCTLLPRRHFPPASPIPPAT